MNQLFLSTLRRTVAAVAGIVFLATSSVAQDLPPTANGFEHVPLAYRGPDPTSNYFLPTANGFESRLARLPSPSEVLPQALPAAPEEYIEYAAPQESWVVENDCSTGHVSDHKDGFFQAATLTGTYIDRGSLNSFGINELDFSLAVAVPAPTREWPMLITTAFNVRTIDGPATPMLPAKLYEAYIDFLWVPRLSERWTAIIGVAPSMYTDFEIDSSEGFRLTGKALARYDWIPCKLQVVGGILFLNRDDVPWLPAGGLIWNPSVEQRYELIFPRPKLAHRIASGPKHEDWLYISGEFGGNSYGYQRGAIIETVTLRDYRLLLGIERTLNGGAGYRIEVGYVFGRTAEFATGIPDINADSTALVRGGFTY
jgi:hypothetical protein